MKFIRLFDNNDDMIVPIGYDDSILLLNKNNDNIKPRLVLHKKNYDIVLHNGNDPSIYDLYTGIINWLSSGKAYGEHTNLFEIEALDVASLKEEIS